MASKQRTLFSFLKRKKLSDSESSQESVDESEYVVSKGRSMFKQQMLWTRVKEIDTNVNRRIGAFDVEEDLKSDKVLK